MELLGVTASVVGIVAFTLKALGAIDNLRVFCKQYSPEETAEFRHDLDTSARILIEVKSLCKTIQDQFPNEGSGFRIASLQVQVEDCTRDLIQFSEIVQPRRKRRGGLRSANGTSDEQKKFRQFKDFLAHLSKGHRAGPHERFRIHHENVQTALALTGRYQSHERSKSPLLMIAGRYLDVENSALLHIVGGDVRQLARRFSDDIKEKTKSLESLSSSGSAVLALSRSTNDRLEDVQSTTNDISAELKNMKQLLFEVLSNSSSSAISSDRGKVTAGIPKQDPAENLDLEEQSRPLGAQTNDSTADKHEHEFHIVLGASKHFARTVHHSYNPFLADYTCALYAWQTSDLCGRLMKLELPTGFWNHKTLEGKASRKMDLLMQRTQTQILALRKTCLAEGLGEDLKAIDAEMGMSDNVLDAWSEEESRRQLRSRRLLLGNLESPADRKKEQLTRLNEWLLQMRECHEYLGQLHQGFWYVVHTVDGVTRHIPPLPKDWDRLTLKYWFSDTAAMVTEDYATSSLGGGDSEATFKPLHDENELSMESHKDPDEPLGYTQSFRLQPIVPLSKAGADSHKLRYYISSTADGFDPEVVAAAQDTLFDYVRQPTHAGSVETTAKQEAIIELTTKPAMAENEEERAESFKIVMQYLQSL